MEEKIIENSKRCYGCFAYQCYYTKGYMRFNREKCGYCIYNEKSVGNKDTCEKWRSNEGRRYRMDRTLVKALNETIGELVEITSIIKENLETKKKNSEIILK